MYIHVILICLAMHIECDLHIMCCSIDCSLDIGTAMLHYCRNTHSIAFYLLVVGSAMLLQYLLSGITIMIMLINVHIH